MTSVRVGVVGCGLMGRIHSRNVNALGGQVVAGADIDDATREEFEDEFGVPTYEDHATLLEEATPDAVVVATPNRYHEPVAVAALEAGTDVFIEKPLAHNLESAERIATATREAPGFCMVGFHSRFSPAATATRAYIDDGRFGGIEHVEATYVRRRGVPSPGSWFTNSDLSGGGALIDVGVHVLDLAMYMLDYPMPVEVSGTTRSNFGPREDYADPEEFASTWQIDAGTFDVEDSVSAFVRFATGQTISLEVAWATNRPPGNELTLRGTEAGAKFDIEGEVVDVYEARNLGIDHYVTSELDARGGPDGHVVEIEKFLEACESGSAPPVNTIEQGLLVQRVIDAIYQSSETGRARPVESGPVDDRRD